MRFGVREICDVTFKALDAMTVGTTSFVAGQPVFMIDTATTSNMEQASTTVYAQGGRGNNRLIAWEGEKTMTFTVTDALMSPMGLAVLSGAGLIDAAADNLAHVHVTYDVTLDANGKGEVTLAKLVDELGLDAAKTTTLNVCGDIQIYATVLDSAGAAKKYIAGSGLGTTGIIYDNKSAADYKIPVTKTAPFEVTIADAKSQTVKLDFYVVFASGVQTVSIEPDSFGGFFYVEADTLFRDEATGKDLAASLIFPKVKVQSGFTFTMAATGDPSTFDFVMDAFPAYTYFDKTKKVVCDMQIVSGADTAQAVETHKEIPAKSHTAANAGA